MEAQQAKPRFHNQLAKNFIILTGLVLGGWFIYYSFAPPAYIVQYTMPKKEDLETTAAIKGTISDDGIFKGNGFRLKPPSGWSIGNASAIDVAAVFISPIEDKTKTKIFHSNINVVMEQTALSLDAYVKSNREMLQRSVKKYTSTEFRKTSINGIDGYMIGGIFTQEGEQLRNRQLIAMNGNMVYIVTGTALDSVWTRYMKQINDTLASFDL